MSIAKLSPESVADALTDLPEWRLEDDKLHRELVFDDFVDAFGFMTKLALIAEQMSHHPEWSNVYNRLTIDLTTHDAGGISKHDTAFATKVDSLLQSA